MTIREIMKYVESEYKIINYHKCSVCGGKFITSSINIDFEDSMPYDVCECVCENCGNKKIFKFHSPFVDNEDFEEIKHTLN